MEYEKTGSKVNKDTGKNATKHSLKGISTQTLLWAIVTRHKFGLVCTYAVFITICYVLPFLPGELWSLIGK